MGERVITPEAAEQLIYMMNQVIEGGTGTRAKLPDREAAGKTGTTQAARDAWFLGFTADYVAGVWMGYDDNKPLTGVTGSGLPAEIWHEVMTRVEADQPPTPLPMIRPEEVPAPAWPGQTYEAGGQGIAGAQAQPPAQPAPASNDQTILDILGAILGRRN